MALAIGTISLVLLAAQRIAEDVLIGQRHLPASSVHGGALLLLAVAVAAVGVFFRGPLIRTISSLRFACLQLVIITLFTIIGTWIVQTGDRAEFQRIYGEWFARHGPRAGGNPLLQREMPPAEAEALMAGKPLYEGIGSAFDLLSRFECTDIFHSWWYNGLLGMLVLSAASAVFAGERRGRRRLGFILIHCSAAVVLAGSLIGCQLGAVRGYLFLREGAGRDDFVPSDRGQNRGAGVSMAALEDPLRRGLASERLPFRITLHKFEEKRSESIFKLYYAVRERKPDSGEGRLAWGSWHPAWALDRDHPVVPAQTDTRTGRTRLVGSCWSVIVRKELRDRDGRPHIFADLFEGNGSAPYTQIHLTGSIDDREDTRILVDDTVALWLRAAPAAPEEYNSTVSISHDGRTTLDHARIGVNHPLAVDGYSIYQYQGGTAPAAAGKRAGSWSIFQIVRDRGIPIVFIGFIALFIGLVLKLMVNPWRKGRQKKAAFAKTSAAKAAAEPSGEPAPPGSNRLLDFVLYVCGVLMLGLFAYICWRTFNDRLEMNNLQRAGRLLTATVALTAVAALSYVLNVFFLRDRPFGRFAFLLLFAAAACNAAYVIAGWMQSGRPPISSISNVSILIGGMMLLCHLVIERLRGIRVIGPIMTVAAMGLQRFAVMKFDPELAPLPPALRSGWFVPHVLAYSMGYALVAIGAVAAGLWLITPRAKTLTAGNSYIFGGARIELDRYAYRSVTLGFVFITAGLLTGAWWAGTAWGDWWFWDPKETWGLVSWLVFLTFLHLRRLPGWEGRRAMIFCLIGIGAVAFTYFAMDILPSAPHSVHVYTSE